MGDSDDIVTLSSTTVVAGEEFTITPKKRTVEIAGEAYEVNIGGEVEIVAKSANDYKSCKLYITVDVQIPDAGLQVLGMDGGEYLYSEDETPSLLGYKLNRVGDGLFKLAIQTIPSNALEPNTGRYSKALNLGYKIMYLDFPEDSCFEIAGEPTTRISYYSENAKKYFEYTSYSTSATKNQDGTYSLTIGGETYSDLIITEHYIYTLQLSDRVSNNTYGIQAKAFKTYAVQRDFLEMQANFEDHIAPNVNEYQIFCNFVEKYKSYIIESEEGESFLEQITNSVGDIQINTLEGYNTAMSYLYVYSSADVILEDIDITSMNTEKTSVSFGLHSNTYTTEEGNVVTYDLNNLSKEDVISIFGINLSVVGSSSPIATWVGDIQIISLKGIDNEIIFDDIIQVNEDGTLSVKTDVIDTYDNSNIIGISYIEGVYKIEILDELETDSNPVLLFATRYGSGDTFTTKYQFCTVSISSITTNIASSLSINTNMSTGGINTTMVTNSESLTSVKQQEFNVDDTILMGAGLTDSTSPLSYSTVKLFAVAGDDLFVDFVTNGTTYPRIALNMGGDSYASDLTTINYILNGSAIVNTAYELPIDSESGNYYIRALNNSGETSLKIFAAIVKTDIDGNVIYDEVNGYIFINKSSDVSISISTQAEAEDLNWYIENDGTYYKKGILADSDLKLLLYENYDILATLYDLNTSGEVVVPTVENGVNYLYNMDYAFADFSSTCDTVQDFRASEGISVISTSSINTNYIISGTILNGETSYDITDNQFTIGEDESAITYAIDGFNIKEDGVVIATINNDQFTIGSGETAVTYIIDSINAVQITIQTLQSTTSETPINRRKLIAVGYANNGLELSVSKISIMNPVISLVGTINGVIDTAMALSGTHSLNPLIVSKEFTSGGFVWTAGSDSEVLTTPTGVALTYNTDIDISGSGEDIIWPSKIDEAFRTETNISIYKANLAAQLSSEEGSLSWLSSNTGVISLGGTNGNELSILGGSLIGEECSISCQIDTYQNNDGGSNTVSTVAYLKTREYPVEMNLYILQSGTVLYDETSTGDTSYLVSNSATIRLGITDSDTVFDFETVIPYYVTDETGNILVNINIFSTLFKESGYSLEVGDIVQLTGNAKFTASTTTNQKTITITTDMLENGTLNMTLDDYTTAESISFEIIKKNVNIYNEYMEAGQLIKITTNNASFYNSTDGSYYNYLLITDDMIAAKYIVATLGTGATSTEISFSVYNESDTLDSLNFMVRDDEESDWESASDQSPFEIIQSLIGDGGTATISIRNAVFIFNGIDDYASITIDEDTDLSDYILAFRFSDSSTEANIPFKTYRADGTTVENTGSFIAALIDTDASGMSEASQSISEINYSYKTNKLINVFYNGESLLTGEMTVESVDTELTDNRVLNYGGVRFTLPENYSWSVTGGVATIVVPTGAGCFSINVAINGDSQAYYITYSEP